LQTLVDNEKRHAAEPSPQSRQETLSTPRDSQQMESELGFEGDSSFNAHSKHVAQAFENSLNSTPASNPVRGVSAAVATLRSFLYEKSAFTDGSIPLHKPLQEAVHYPELSNLPLPPVQAVLTVLRYCKCECQRLASCPTTILAQAIDSSSS
jgi:hypothetical protein